MSCLIEAENFYKNINDENGLMWIYNEFGRLHYFLSDYSTALSYYYRTLELARKLGNTNREAASLNNIGLVYYSIGHYDDAIQVLKESLEITQRTNDKWVEGFIMGTLAEIHYHIKEYQKALDYGLKSLELAKQNGIPTLTCGTLIALSWTYFELNNFEKAEECLNLAYETAQKAQDLRGMGEVLRARGEQANRKNLPNEALSFLFDSLETAKTIGEKSFESNCHKAIAESYRQIGDYKNAFEHFKIHSEIERSIFNEKSDFIMKTLSISHKLEMAQQEAEIYRLRNILLQKEIEDERKVKKALEHLANHDPLTGLFNRRTFFKHGEKLLKISSKTKQPFSLLMLDIDHFKKVNDKYGHIVGDNVLKILASLLRQHLRKIDLICRYGGEEFTILIPGMGVAESEKIANRLCKKIAEYNFLIVRDSINITVSIGVAEPPKDSSISLDELITFADKALYEAKETGRNKVSVYKN